MKKYKHIELFAGCGGLNLGLEKVGFELLFANEISPMAGETFAYNFLNENIERLSEENKQSNKVLWIKSKFAKSDLKNRLRENPYQGEKKMSDIEEGIDLKGKLLIGDVNNLLEIFSNSSFGVEFAKENVDLISGGPPCQSFSLAGRREKDNEKNQLPLTFAKFAGLIKPKIVLLENVKGITSPFTESSYKYYAWLEVSKSFVLEGYYPICMMVNSKYFGVPQNRPRFILLAFRKDIFCKLKEKYPLDRYQEILNLSENFFNKVIENINDLNNITIYDFKYYDIESDFDLFDGNIFPKVTNTKNSFISVKNAIDDLNPNGGPASEFVINLNKIFSDSENREFSILPNSELRSHSVITQARFRFYQVVEQLASEDKRKLNSLLSNKVYDFDIQVMFKKISNFKFLIPIENGKKNEERKLKNSLDFENYINIISTKKHSQRALNKDLPAPAQLTIPDDICHYDFGNPRVLSVREMARIQSFPDWFTFKSKVTTGGKLRKIETPQYTQVGNAVPPLLGLHLGVHIKNLLNKIGE